MRDQDTLRSEAMSQAQGKTFGAYMSEAIEDHLIAEDEDEVIIDVTPKEAEELGLFLIRVISGWARGLKRVRFLRQLAEVETTARAETGGGEEIDGREGEETKTLVH